ncbi:hypothetical protein CYY_000994 [Polysphondylium violaceum]|uniref:Uncharacterized protein n=1 Tax=Polysphondylium violaceum TaxID=133409 RepID=A0A8J4Q0I0_9MYCE|nr:hypothetical protein CYY_000994 [Polysphondylium violaceum]
MGVPSFYRWLIEQYPKVLVNNEINNSNSNSNNNNDSNIQFSNLYIDMNGVIHSAIRIDENNQQRGTLIKKSELSDEMIQKNLYSRLEQIISSVKPTDLIYIGIDGTPPRAKSIEQRKRRFKSSKELVESLTKSFKQQQQKLNELNKANGNSNNITFESFLEEMKSSYFDSNIISPATEFMALVNVWMREYLLGVSERYPNVRIILSDSTVPGEGEHKIMDYIRDNCDANNNNVSHVFYGMDADLIFLGLSTHEKNFYILRDPLDLIYCSTCKGNDHTSYECTSAHAYRKLNSPKENKITLKHIPISCDESDIRNLFQSYGEISTILIEKANTKRPSYTATIEFKDPNTINEITARGGSWEINNERITVHPYYINVPGATNDDNATDQQTDSGTSSPTTSTSETTTTTTTTDTIANEQNEHVPENTVFITCLDSIVSEFDVKSFCIQFGSIEKINVFPSMRLKQKIAQVIFKTQESARAAFKSNGAHFFGASIVIKKAQERTAEEIANNSNSNSTTTTTTSTNGTSSGNSTTLIPQPPKQETPEEKAERERQKQQRLLEKQFKVETFLSMADPGTSKDTAFFYLGYAQWSIEKAFETYCKFDKAPLESPKASTTPVNFDFVYLNHFRDYFHYTITRGQSSEKIAKIDFNRCVNDFTLMCMMLGNDFLPHLPSVSIHNGYIELFLSWYKSYAIGGDEIKYLTKEINNSWEIQYENLLPLLKVLADWESTQFPDNLEKQFRKAFNRKNKPWNKPDTSAATSDSNNNNNNVHTLSEITNIDSSKTSSPLPEFKYNDSLYYESKLHLTSTLQVLDKKEEMTHSFIEGMLWVLKYYTKGCPSWTWFYPFHYAPLVKDLARHVEKLLKTGSDTSSHFSFETGAPIPPLVHLSSVLPKYSKSIIPPTFGKLMDPPSPISHYYRDDFEIDLNGEDVAWKGVVLLDFIDFALFKSTFANLLEQHPECLTEAEKKRNQFGHDITICNKVITESIAESPSRNSNSNPDPMKPLTQRDLSWPTRKIFTLSPFESPNSSKFASIPTTQPPKPVPELVFSPLQTQFIEWRKKHSLNGSLLVLESIDFSKCYILNQDKKNSPLLGRILSNEVFQDKSIFLKSLDDDQMIIHIGFDKPVKLSYIQLINSISNDSSPKIVKFYTNESIDFSNVEGCKPFFTFDFSKDPSKLQLFSEPIPLKTNLISNFTIFIESNFLNDKQPTLLEKIILG